MGVYYVYNRYQQKKMQMDQLHRGQKGWVYEGDDIIMDDYKVSAFSGASPTNANSGTNPRQMEMMSRSFRPSPPTTRTAESYQPSIKGAGAFSGSGLGTQSSNRINRESYNPSSRLNTATGSNGGTGRVGINTLRQHESSRTENSPNSKYFSPNF